MRTLKNIVYITLPICIFLFFLLEITSRLCFPGSQLPKSFWDDKTSMVIFNRNNGSTGLATFGNLAQQRGRWRINNAGWNSPVDYYSERKNGVKRIAVIGDSYVEAFQVDIEKSFPYILAELLGDAFEVYSFGISGAPLSQYLHFARYVESMFSPDIYIFNLIHNDFDESVYDLANRPSVLTLDVKDEIITEINPIPPVRKYKKMPLSAILKKSSLIRFLYSNLQINEFFKFNRGDTGFEMNVYIEKIKNSERIIELATDYLLKTITDELDGKELVFIMDAPRWNIYKDELELAEVTRLNNMVSKLCLKHELTFIDLTTYMLIDFKKNQKRFESDFDGHWNNYGHYFVANVVFNYFNK